MSIITVGQGCLPPMGFKSEISMQVNKALTTSIRNLRTTSRSNLGRSKLSATMEDRLRKTKSSTWNRKTSHITKPGLSVCRCRKTSTFWKTEWECWKSRNSERSKRLRKPNKRPKHFCSWGTKTTRSISKSWRSRKKKGSCMQSLTKRRNAGWRQEMTCNPSSSSATCRRNRK